MPRIALPLAAALCLALPAAAQTVPDRPDGPILDAADLLPPAEEAALAARLAAAAEATGKEVLLVTFADVPDAPGADVDAFVDDLVAEWAVEEGLVVAMFRDRGELRVEDIGGGTGNDAATDAIITETVMPAFAEADYARGLTAGMDRLVVEVLGHDPAAADRTPAAGGEGGGGGLWWLLALIGVPVAGIAALAARSKARLAATPCLSCGQTGTLDRSRTVLVEPTEETEGQGETVTTCSACGHATREPYTIPARPAEEPPERDTAAASWSPAKADNRGGLGDMKGTLKSKTDTRSDSEQR